MLGTFAGHASVQVMTMERYGHLFPTPDHHQKAMASVEARLFG